MSRRWVVLALIFTGILISYVDRGNLGLAATSIMSDFAFPPGTMGVLLSAFFWTYAAFQIPAGTLVDRMGIRRVYAIAFVVWSIASAAIGIARGMTDILLLRMLLGMAEAAGPIASLSYIRRNFAGADIGLPTSIYIAGQNLGPALGALIGTQLIAGYGWRFMFVATGAGALLWLPFWWWLAPRDTPAAARTGEKPKAPVPWREVTSNGAFWAISICVLFSSYFWYFLLTWVPAYLTMSRGFTTVEMGRVLSTPLFAMAVINIGAGFAADRLIRRVGSVFRVRLWFCAAGYVASGSLLLLLVLPGKEVVLPILMVAVVGAGIGNSNYWAIAQHTPPATLVGRTIGFLNTLSQIAGAAAPLVTGWILGPEKQFGTAVLVAGLSAVAGALCLLFVGAAGLDKIKMNLEHS
jgi:ACS family D-galactonate transporter-like MFS transporter